MRRSRSQSRGMVVGLVVCSALLSGCDDSVDREPMVRLSAAEHDSVIQAADSLYDYGPERDTITVTDSAFKGPTVDDGTIPHMTIATATLKPNMPQPAHRIIARISSDGPYEPMGIQPGANYVDRNSWSAGDTTTWVTRIVSRDRATTRTLTRDARRLQYAHDLPPGVPRLVILKVHSIALGLCFDDPGCSSGHCGYY